MKLNSQMRELYNDYRMLERQERLAVRRVNIEERNQYNQFSSCLRQMLVDQGGLLMNVDCVNQVVETLDRTLTDNMLINVEEDKISTCSSLRSIRSVSEGSSRSQSPLCVPDYQPIVLRRERPGHRVSNSSLSSANCCNSFTVILLKFSCQTAELLISILITVFSQSEREVQANRLSYTSLPGERQTMAQERTARTRPSSTYEILRSVRLTSNSDW